MNNNPMSKLKFMQDDLDAENTDEVIETKSPLIWANDTLSDDNLEDDHDDEYSEDDSEYDDYDDDEYENADDDYDETDEYIEVLNIKSKSRLHLEMLKFVNKF